MTTEHEGIMFAGALRRFRPAAIAWLHEQSRAAGVPVAEEARGALLLALRARLCGCAHTALEAERNAVPGRSPQALVQTLEGDVAWARFLAAYPVVARLLDTSFASWKRRIAALLGHVARDGADLGAARPGIEEIVSHGERLEARRTTLSLRLAGGGRWFYREKDLSAAAWLMLWPTANSVTGTAAPAAYWPRAAAMAR